MIGRDLTLGVAMIFNSALGIELKETDIEVAVDRILDRLMARVFSFKQTQEPPHSRMRPRSNY